MTEEREWSWFRRTVWGTQSILVVVSLSMGLRFEVLLGSVEEKRVVGG